MECQIKFTKLFYTSSSDDDGSPTHFTEIQSDSGVANYTLSYPSENYEQRRYTMTIRVFNKWLFARKEIAYNSIKYDITKALNGHMNVKQDKKLIVTGDTGAIVSTKTVTRVEIELYDPHGTLLIYNFIYMCVIWL